MVPEAEARVLLAEHKIERDILENRSCAEIVEALGIISIQESITISNVMSENAKLQAENMTRNVRPGRAPYFVR
jgi:hypothetical protein